MANTVETEKDTLKKHLPGVLKRFDTLQSGQNCLQTSMDTHMTQLQDQVQEVLDNVLRHSQVKTIFKTIAELDFDNNKGTTEQSTKNAVETESVAESKENDTMKESVIEETTPYKLEQNHVSILTIVDEWYGKGLYSRKFKLPGGLEMLEETQKHSWRTYFDYKEKNEVKDQSNNKKYDYYITHIRNRI